MCIINHVIDFSMVVIVWQRGYICCESLRKRAEIPSPSMDPFHSHRGDLFFYLHSNGDSAMRYRKYYDTVCRCIKEGHTVYTYNVNVMLYGTMGGMIPPPRILECSYTKEAISI